MEDNRGPVIWTALYVAALVLTWTTLFSLERFGATEVRSWSPLIQAVLTSAAIFSAWWLQSEKRKADKKDAIAHTVHSLVATSYHIESAAAKIARLSLQKRMNKGNLSLHVSIIESLISRVSDVNVAHLRSKKAIWAYYGFCEQVVQLISIMNILKGIEQQPAEKGQLFERYDHLWRARNDLLEGLEAQDLFHRNMTPEEIKKSVSF